MRGATEQQARVLVTYPLRGPAMDRLREAAAVEVWEGTEPIPRSVLERGCATAEGLLCMLTDRVDASLLARAPRLRVISSLSVGLDHVDLATATQRGIPVGHTPGVLTETTADLALALLLAAARRIPEADRFVREGAWAAQRGWDPQLLLGADLHGATLGVLGLGAIGQAVVRRAQGFGMRVLGWSRSGRRVPGVETVGLEDVFRGADFVSIHVALTPETRHLVNRERLALAKPGLVLVNTSRGEVVDEGALVGALRSGRVAAAGLDVFEREPLAPTSPLVELENVVLTPHIGSATHRTRARMAELAVENLLAGLTGRPLPACANPEVGGRSGG